MKTAFLGLIGLLFFVSLFLEGTVTTLPLVLLFLLALGIARQDEAVFVLALLAGILLDILALRPVGETGIFYVVFLFLVLLYDRKYEIHSLPFMVVSSFLGSFVYLLLFVRQEIFLQSVASVFLGVVIFLVFRLSKSSKASTYKIL